jgi:hypothetical protein
MRHHRMTLLPVAVTALLLTAVADAFGQACIGVPSGDGQFALQAGVGLTSGATSYGADFAANVHGPFAVGVSYALTNLDDAEPNGSTFGSDVAFEVPGVGVSLCPAFGIVYSRASGLSTNIYPGPYTTVTTVSWSLEVRGGKALSVTPALFATPFAGAGLVFLHSVAQAKSGGFSTPKYKKDDSAFSAVLGLLIGSRRVHAGANVSFTTIENSDPLVTLGVGFVF